MKMKRTTLAGIEQIVARMLLVHGLRIASRKTKTIRDTISADVRLEIVDGNKKLPSKYPMEYQFEDSKSYGRGRLLIDVYASMLESLGYSRNEIAFLNETK
jgi:hypothetical protein